MRHRSLENGEEIVKQKMRVLYFLGAWILACLSVGGAAHAFEILTPRSDACHEKMMLGTFDRYQIPFSFSTDMTLEPLLRAMSEGVEGVQVPLDKATEGFIEENTKRFGLSSLSHSERFVLSSLIAGVRSPDTDGFALVDVNQIRSIHVQDQKQAAHALRRSSMDSDVGDLQAIKEIKERILSLAREVVENWRASGSELRRERWTFAFYGEADVLVYGPAYDIGVLSHIIQDAYAHTVRDQDLRVLAVLNYVDVMNEMHNEARDGPAHSDRLDLCNGHFDEFDLMRVEQASIATSQVLDELFRIMGDPNRDWSGFKNQVDSILEYRSGCGHETAYCGSVWYQKAAENFTEPMSLAVCGSVPRQHVHSSNDAGGSASRALSGALCFAMALVFWLHLRGRSLRPI